MAKYTLIDMVQRILSSMDSDNVNSFSDTIESEQVAFIVRDSYYDLVKTLDLPEEEGFITLTAAADSDFPTQFTIPEEVKKLLSVRYDSKEFGETKLDYLPIPYVSQEVFIEWTNSRDSTDSTVQTVSMDGAKLFIRNERSPTYFTSFNENTLVFDAFDSDVESTLQSSKMIARGVTEAVFTLADGFVPSLDSNMFSLLLEEAKSTAFVELKQSSNPKAEQRARKQRVQNQNDRHKIEKNLVGQPNYGRRGKFK
jgi:hypothetical protein